MTTVTAMLGLLAETSLHAGAGQSVGVIDLPIQREAHTGWPVIFGSGVKGALRAKAEGSKPNWIKAVFGPDTESASDNAGALLVGDARLLLLPVRSLTSHFRWVTCPALLRRFNADRERLGLGKPADVTVPELPPDSTTALVCEAGGKPLFLEEFRFEKEKADLDKLIAALAPLLPVSDAVTRLREQLAIVSDDLFTHLSRYATPVNAHVRLDNGGIDEKTGEWRPATKTVCNGALWYEETLPPDTLLYVALAAQRSRVAGCEKTAADILAHVTQELFEKPYLQLGGNETVGMGWCKVARVNGGAA